VTTLFSTCDSKRLYPSSTIHRPFTAIEFLITETLTIVRHDVPTENNQRPEFQGGNT
jgi:hypothetical protein